ncbi:rCG63590, isoform CRA_a [Rattus norvegicus]|uniref:RCG63590, isoform CRA_a n=1 Tax=Rattus norvegicus TaxID=10116 RepID=A6I4K8_RAT|nr:rCG63590, isoform CRA_a [Rattus norvegicus]EDM09966.1 rCG63590, isoform CRA_a [Rattus norvegicus]
MYEMKIEYCSLEDRSAISHTSPPAADRIPETSKFQWVQLFLLEEPLYACDIHIYVCA